MESAEEPQHYQHHHHPHQPNDPVDDDDPLRGAYEDSTIGRDHSVLPPGARPSSNRRHSTHAYGGEGAANSGSSSDERPPRKVIISPMVQPELVATGRLENGCFTLQCLVFKIRSKFALFLLCASQIVKGALSGTQEAGPEKTHIGGGTG